MKTYERYNTHGGPQILCRCNGQDTLVAGGPYTESDFEARIQELRHAENVRTGMARHVFDKANNVLRGLQALQNLAGVHRFTVTQSSAEDGTLIALNVKEDAVAKALAALLKSFGFDVFHTKQRGQNHVMIDINEDNS